MRRQYHLIYIPGLGDNKARGQKFIVRTWSIYGAHGHCYQMRWGDGELFEPKFKRLMTEIDELISRGYKVSLIGSSAGASAVLKAYAERKESLSGVAIICGKVQNIETVSPEYFKRNPAFEGALKSLPDILLSLPKRYRTRILSIHPIYDETVPINDTEIEDAQMATIPTFGHALSIALSLIFFSPYIIHFLKKQN